MAKALTRNLAFAFAMGAGACAHQQVKTEPPPKVQEAPKQTRKACDKRRALQTCLIETIATSCGLETEDQAKYVECVSNKLSTRGVAGETKGWNVSVSPGEEVFAIRYGNGGIYEVVSMDVISVD